MDFPRLHPDTIDEIKQRVDIIDVISNYVVLKKRGKNFLGLCPFHQEKTPSFTVSPTKQMYYCFGCQEGGNVFKFLMEVGKQSFAEVVFDLAKTYQVPIKTLEPAQKQALQRQISLREQLYEVLAVAGSFYHHALYQPQGEIALKYLKEKRHLTDEIIEQFQLGYAPEGWETLYRYLVEQKRYPLSLVEEAGLIKLRKKGSGHYDQFRDRLMIPIFDPKGRLIAFGSRTLGNDEPKYLNSPETPLFNKSKTLFALDKAKEGIGKQDRAIVVEGYFDAIALHSKGFTYTVASLGTAFTQDQLRLLLRYSESKQVIFNFDADTAGIKATQRAISDIESLVYSGQVQLRILNLSGGKDADEFLHSSEDSVAQYQDLINNAPLWFDWQLQQLLEDKNLKEADQFEQVAKEMVNLLNHLENGNQRTHYLEKCASILSLGNSQLIPLYLNNLQAQLRKPLIKNVPRSLPSTKTSKKNITKLKSEKNKEKEALRNNETLLLQIYLHFPQHRHEIIQQLTEQDLFFCIDDYRKLWQIIVEIQEEEPDIMNNMNNRLMVNLEEKLLSSSLPNQSFNSLFYLLDEKTQADIYNPSLQIQQVILRLKIISLEKYARYCSQQWIKAHQKNNNDLFHYYSEERTLTYQQIKELKQQINLV
ncbi:MAG: DNA primase [Microcystaceae cyanobacterium]